MLPEEYQIHKLVLLFCFTLYTCVFVEPYKKEMKKNRGGGRGSGKGERKRQIALLLPGVLSLQFYQGWRGGSSVSAAVDAADGAACHCTSQMLIIS